MSVLSYLAAAGYILFWMIVMAFGARRMLGLVAGPPRLFLAGLAGLTVAVLVIGPRAGEHPALIPLFVGIGLLVSMGLLILGEIVAPPGARLRPLHWYRSYQRWRQRTKRYSQITRIAVRHGLGAYLTGRRDPRTQARTELARRLRLALEEAGVAFVKIGQMLSTRHDLLPPEFTRELSRLQSEVAPVGREEVESLLTKELGAPADEVFAAFEPEPLAAASIGQVHRARLLTGEDVVVKVRRPGVRTLVEGDLDIMLRLARMLEQRARWARSLGTAHLAESFAETLREELDFGVEARNMATVLAARSAPDDERVLLPRPHQEWCSEAVLVMDHLDGLPLHRAAPVIAEHGLDRSELARRLLHTLLTQIMVDGVFHADPHPGNVLILRDGRVALLDFGSVGRLDAALRDVLLRLMLAVDAVDAAALSDALIDVAERPEHIDEKGLERAIARFMARHLGPGRTADLALFTDMLRLVTRYGIAVPAELATVFRSLATAEGTLGQLAPGFDLVEESRSFATAHLHRMVSPRSLRTAAAAEFLRLLPLMRRLPRRVDRLTSALEEGRLSTGIRILGDEGDRRVVTGLVHQTVLSVLAAALGVVAAILLGTPGGPGVGDGLSLYQLISYSLLLLSGALTLRVLTSLLRHR